jgi:hypothetical protein
MNEQTIKLYEEATKFAYETVGKEHSDKSYFQAAIAGKFAELIVRECAGVDFRREVGLTADDDYEIGKVIKEHFGVEP